MKKIIHLCLGAFFFFTSCNQEKEIKKIIMEDVRQSIPSYWNYEPVYFSEIDSAMSNVKYTNQEEKLYEEMLALDSSFVMDIESEYSEREEINKKLTELESKYIPHYIGKQIYHIYQCHTDFGDSIYCIRYVFNDLYEIIDKEVTPQIPEKVIKGMFQSLNIDTFPLDSGKHH